LRFLTDVAVYLGNRYENGQWLLWIANMKSQGWPIEGGQSIHIGFVNLE